MYPVGEGSDARGCLQRLGEKELVTTTSKDLIRDGGTDILSCEKFALVPLKVVDEIGDEGRLDPVGMHNGGVNVG